MNRRKFLKITSTGGLAIVCGGTAITWFSIEESSKTLNTNSLLTFIDALMETNIVSNGQWDPYTIFVHCAQSVDYSIDGYPQHNSDLFKNTIGKIAFSAFSAKRKMSHNLAEVIPGAPAITPNGNIKVALAQLRTSLIRFQAFNGPLKAHFAYGELTKEEYELAHAMHFINHLKELVY